VRHEGVFDDPGWADRVEITVPDDLGQWIGERLGHQGVTLHED
jgi:hypothetical protein